MSICGGNVIAPTSTVPGPAGSPWRSAWTLLGDLRDELVVDRRLDVHALDRDAGLAAVLHRVVRRRRWRRARGRRRRARSSGPCRRARATPASASRRRAPSTLLAGRRRAGEHDHVDGVDQRLAGRRRAPVATWKTPSGTPHSLSPSASSSEVSGVTSRRLEDHGVARRERRDRVAEGVRQRVVPRADHADDAERLGSARRSFLPSTSGLARADLLVGQVLRARAWPRSRTRRRRRRPRRASRPRSVLPVSADDRLDDPVGVVDSHFCMRRSTLAATLEPERLPARLRRARARDERSRRRGRHRRGADRPPRSPGPRRRWSRWRSISIVAIRRS